MITAVTFDLWNTLFTNISYTQIRLKFLIKYIEKKKINYDIKELQHQFDRFFNLKRYNPNIISNLTITNHIFTEDRIINLFETLKIELHQKEIDLIKINFEKAILENPPKLKLNAKKTLKSLAHDYKIGLISDTGITPGYILRRIMKKHRILRYFDTTVFSDEVGYYKPHPLLFEIALKELGVKPQNAIHIGDLLETDIQGAKDYNMLSVWINNSHSPKIMTFKPDYIISNIFEAIDIIKYLS